MLRIVFVGLLLMGAVPQAAAQPAGDLNALVLEKVEDFAKNRAKGGYDLGANFTRTLSYDGVEIRATRAPATMCVAAVGEVMIEAINEHVRRTGDRTAYQRLPSSSWTRGNLTSIRANIWQFAGTGSRGVGHSLRRLGIGDELKFPELKPGDFINLNRTNGSGHAAVFLGYITPDGRVTPQYAANVVGFKYFSAQGKGKPDAGFAYRFAYFDGACPATAELGPRDCSVIKSSNTRLLSGGRLYAPTAWKVIPASEVLSRSVRSAVEARSSNKSSAFIDQEVRRELEQELTPRLDAFTGETTD